MEKSLPLQTLLLISALNSSQMPGLWPLDPEECAGIGFLLGLALENSLDEYLADLSEPRLALLEAQVVNFGTSLEEIFIEMLIESKSLAAHTVG